MPLQRQVLQTGFRFGVDEGTDPHQVPFGVLTRAENARWVKSGRIQKRFGMNGVSSSLIGGGSIGALQRMWTRGGELCGTDGSRVYSYTGYGWRDVGAAPSVGVSWRNIVDQGSGVSLADSRTFTDAAGNTLVCVMWATGNPRTASSPSFDVLAAVFDAATGSTVLSPTNLGTGLQAVFAVRVVLVGTTLVLLHVPQSGGNLAVLGRTIDTTTLTLSGSTTIVGFGSVSGSSLFDAEAIGSNFAMAYTDAGGTTRVQSRTTGFALNNEYTLAATSGIPSLGGDGSQLYFGLANNVRVLNPASMTLAAGPTSVGASCTVTGIVKIDSSNALVLWRDGSATPNATACQVISSGAVLSATTKRQTWNVLPLSRPFLLNGSYYALVMDDAFNAGTSFAGQNTYLVECETSTYSTGFTDTLRYVAKVDHLVGGTVLSSAPRVQVTGTGTSLYAVAPWLSTVPTTTNAWLQGLRLVNITAGSSLPRDMWRPVTYGQETYLAAGFLAAYDGFGCFDYGFPRSPIITSAVTAAGGSMAAGSYLYGYHNEYKSKAGVLHRSATTTRQVTGVPATGQVTHSINYANVTAKSRTGVTFTSVSPVAVPIFRSVVSGSTPQRLTLDPALNVVTVDLASGAQTFVDQRSDASIDGTGTLLASRPVMYTVGGILDDVSPPSVQTLTLHRQRLWAVGPDLRTVWYSKSFLDDQGTAPGFNEALRILTDEPVTALASMDDKLVVFSNEGVSYLLGDGPAANGQGGDFSALNSIQTDVGCANPRSVVSTPDGIMFQTQVGTLSLLTRGLEVVWVGKPVQDVLTSFPTITSAVLVPSRNEVRFTCNAAGGSPFHVVLVWNYVEKQWSTFRYLGGNGTINDATLWSGVYTAALSTGVLREDTTTYLDNGTYVSMALETAWVSASGPLAFQSVREMSLEGISNSNHDLTVEVGFDGESSYTQTKTFAAGSDVTAIGPYEELVIGIGTRRKCNHIRFRIADATPTNPGTYPVGTGQGPTFDAIGIEVGMKQGFSNNPATKRG